MNHVYRVVFNRSLGVYQCVSELAKSRGKSASGKSQTTTKLLLNSLAVAMLGLSGTAMAADIVINDGQRTEFNNDIAINGDVLITGAGTVIAAPNNEINFGLNDRNIVTTVAIRDSAKIEANTVSFGANGETEVIVDNASINASNLALGADSFAGLNITNNARLDVDNALVTGFSAGASSALIVDAAGKVTANDLLISRLENTDGTVVVDGAGSRLDIQDNVFVGVNGLGSLSIQSGGQSTSNSLFIASDQGSADSSVEVSGVGSSLIVDDFIGVGGAESGELNISNSGQVSSDKMSIGILSEAVGAVNVSGSGSALDNSTLLVVGAQGLGVIKATDNATINSFDTELGLFENSLGAVILNDEAQWNNQNTLSVGGNGTGLVRVDGVGTLLTTDTLNIGSLDGESAVSVIDIGSIDANQVVVGGTSEDTASYSGALNVVDASLQAENVNVGAYGNGILNIIGSSSYVGISNDLVIGDNGTGTLDMIYAEASDPDDTPSEPGFGGGSFGFGNALDVGADTIIGGSATGEGTINIAGPNDFVTNNLIIGQQGSGEFNVLDTNYGIGLTRVIDTTYIGGLGDESTDATGTLTIENSIFITPRMVVGNTGAGTLNIINGGDLVVDSIERNTASTLSNIFIDNGEISINSDQENLFANFTSDNKIELGANGVRFYTQGLNEYDESFATNVIINPNAVITGDVGKIDHDTNIGGFVKYGSGTLELSDSSKQWTGDLGVIQGTLKFNGDYAMVDGETLTIGLLDQNDNGIIDNDEYGKFLVNGQVDINKGNLYVYADEAVGNMSQDSEWQDIVKGTTREGEFTAVNDNSMLVSFVADYSDPNAVHLTMVKLTPPVEPEPPVVVPPVNPEPPVLADTTFVESITSQSNRNDAGIAYVLDRAITDRVNNGNNALADALISSTVNFDQAQLAAAANQLQPLFMGATNRIITDANYAVSKAISEHNPAKLERSLWAKIIGNDSSHDAENGITGYDAKGYGAIVGLDTPVNNNLNLGLAVSYIKSDADTEDSRLDHELTAKNWQVLGYGRYDINGATELNFHAGAGRSDVDGERHIQIITDSVAKADYSVDTLQAGLGVGHRIGNELRHVTPFAQVNYAQAKSDSYRETGAGVYNLNVDENKYESMRWTAGLRLSQALTPMLAVTGQLAAAIENGDRRSDITASFIGMPDDKFTTIGQEVGREIGIAGIGLSYTPTLNTKLSVGYRGEWRDNYNDQGATIALQTTF